VTFKNSVVIRRETFADSLDDDAQGPVVLDEHDIASGLLVEVIIANYVSFLDLQLKGGHDGASTGRSEQQTLKVEYFWLFEGAAKVADVGGVEHILVNQGLVDLGTLLLLGFLKFVIGSDLLGLSNAYDSGYSFENADLSNYCAETLNRVFNKLVLFTDEPLLFDNLELDLWQQLVGSLAFVLLDLGHDLVHLVEGLWLAHLDFVPLEHILTESYALEGFVALADVLGEEQLVGLNVRVDVNIVDEVKFEQLVERVPVLVTLNRHLEETHGLRAELTHY